MATNRITVVRNGDAFVVTSNDINVKEVFFSWASGDEYPEFYGKSIEYGQCHNPDWETWEWQLTSELVSNMISNLDGLQGESEKEEKASRDVERALSAALNGTQLELDEFTKQYIVTALWVTNDNSDEGGGNPLDDNYGVDDLSPEALQQAIADCKKFQADNLDMISEDLSQAGHDFFLTRNGHGCWFLDRPNLDKPVRDALVKASKQFGECYIEVGDDNKLHGF